MSDESAIREVVRERYAAAARRASEGDVATCCGDDASCCGTTTEKSFISSALYSDEETASLPAAAALASLGCGNPTALAELSPGEDVLDLGSGGGIDVLLSAQRVGPGGVAYGIDMTDEMLELARRNQRDAGVTNAEFLKGTIEDLPLPDESVDVVISNCVINLSSDKDAVLREAFRVLRPGGRFAVSDIIFRGAIPDFIRGNVDAWSGCVAGALHEDEYRAKLAAAGFNEIDVEVTRAYEGEEVRGMAKAFFGLELDAGVLRSGQVCSAFVRARRPA